MDISLFIVVNLFLTLNFKREVIRD
jgi:hypothetical protein